MRKMFFILAIGLFPFLTFSQDNNSAKQMEVMMKMGSLRNALLARDSVTLNNVLSNELTYGHSTGLIQTKSQLIRSVMSKEQDYKSIEPSNMDIRIYDNTAIVTMQSKVKLVMQGKPLDLSMNVLLVWIKKNEGWKLVGRQSAKND